MYGEIDLYVTNNPGSTRRLGDVPWRFPKNSSLRDLERTLREILGKQQKKIMI